MRARVCFSLFSLCSLTYSGSESGLVLENSFLANCKIAYGGIWLPVIFSGFYWLLRRYCTHLCKNLIILGSEAGPGLGSVAWGYSAFGIRHPSHTPR